MFEYEVYRIKYNYGLHHLEIYVDETEFNKVIDEITKEFTIYKRESLHYDSGGFNYIEVVYFIINYWKEIEIIGICEKRV